MNSPHPDKPHILFIFSDTGGGHRSAAEAIIEAINIEYPDKFTCEMVDMFRSYAPPPLSLAPEIYPPLSRMPELWYLGYQLGNGRRRNRFFTNVLLPYMYRASRRMIKEHPCDLIVSIHPLTNAPVRRAISEYNIPFITIITDMVSVHASWYDPHADLIIVSTEEARKRGISLGLDPKMIVIAGQPVAERFNQPPPDVNALRARFGWRQDIPLFLLVGGGEGMGPLGETAIAIDHAALNAGLVIISGRNHKLKHQLEQHRWKKPAYIYGYIHEMPDFMAAVDGVVTKAGPGTISEAFLAGLPIIIYSRIPGQEDGNVHYVVDKGAGVWAPKPEQVVQTIRSWLDNPETLSQISYASKQLARPYASRQIARLIAAQIGFN
jgi:1,2-diacylglycerol 3-beta-galactosyltransferase